jgi:hypothetical protein
VAPIATTRPSSAAAVFDGSSPLKQRSALWLLSQSQNEQHT